MKPRHLTTTLSAAALLGVLTAPVLAAEQEPPCIPARMLPGSILLYGEDLQPAVVRGGYLPDEAESAEVPLPTPRDIPENATEDAAVAIRLQNQVAAIRYFDTVAGCAPRNKLGGVQYRYDEAGIISSLAYDPGPGVYAGMCIDYGPDGFIQNIYYPDPSEPTGYSIHNAPPEEYESVQRTVCSAALPFVQWTRSLLIGWNSK